jgi:hypothetical protein
MNNYDLHSLGCRTREHHGQRLREADAERLARGLRGTAQSRTRLRLIIGLSLKPRHRADQPSLEA